MSSTLPSPKTAVLKKPSIGKAPHKNLFFVPQSILCQPIDGSIACHRWWIVHKQLGVVFFYRPPGVWDAEDRVPRFSIQANKSKDVVKHLLETMYSYDPEFELRYLDVAFLGHCLPVVRSMDKEYHAKHST